MNPTLCLAPILGFTTFVYRNTFTRFFGGLDFAVSPFISTVSSTAIRNNYLKDVWPENNQSLPVVPQLIGKSPDDFIRMAKRLHDLGHETVNWNLGCPYPMVAKKGRGSGMLVHPELVDAFLEKVIPAIPGKLSVKTRIGRFSGDEMQELMPVFNRYPLSELIIHPRTGVQMYEGLPDLDVFESCLAVSVNPVVYNGDIVSLKDFRRLSGRFPSVERWMLGRGVLINPFLPEIIRAGEDRFTEKEKRFQEFHDDLFKNFSEALSGPSHPVARMKGFWYYFHQAFDNSSKTIKKIQKVRTPENYLEIVNRFLETEAVWRTDI